MSFQKPTGSTLLVGTGWRDQLIPGSSAGVGGGAPTLGAWTEIGSFVGYTMAATPAPDELHGVFHINHDYKPGSQVHFHVHWIPSDNGVGNVTWRFAYAHLRGNQDAYSAFTNEDITEAAPGVAGRHVITETAAVTIANLEVDSLILCKLILNAKGVGAPANIRVLTFDMHYQSDRYTTSNRTKGAGWDP